MARQHVKEVWEDYKATRMEPVRAELAAVSPNAAEFIPPSLLDDVLRDGISKTRTRALDAVLVAALQDRFDTMQRAHEAKHGRLPYHNADHMRTVTGLGSSLVNMKSDVGTQLSPEQIMLMQVGWPMHDLDFEYPEPEGIFAGLLNEEVATIIADPVYREAGLSTHDRAVIFGANRATALRFDNSIKPETPFEAEFVVPDLCAGIAHPDTERWIVSCAQITEEMMGPDGTAAPYIPRESRGWMGEFQVGFMGFALGNRMTEKAEAMWGDRIRERMEIFRKAAENPNNPEVRRVVNLVRQHVEPVLQRGAA